MSDHPAESPKPETPPQTQERPRTQAPPVVQERVIVPQKPTLARFLSEQAKNLLIAAGLLATCTCLVVIWAQSSRISELQKVHTEISELRSDLSKAATAFLDDSQKLTSAVRENEKAGSASTTALRKELEKTTSATTELTNKVVTAEQKLDEILKLKNGLENAVTYAKNTLTAVTEMEAKIVALQTGVAGLQPSRQGPPVVSKEKEKDKTAVPPPVGNPRDAESLVKEGESLLEKAKVLEGEAKTKILHTVVDKATEAIKTNADYAPAYLLRAQARLALGDRLWRIDNDAAKKLIEKK